MLTRIFHKTMPPAAGRGPAAVRTGRAASGKKAIPGEASGAEPADFRETLLQASAAAGGGPSIAAGNRASPAEETPAPSDAPAAALPSPGRPPDEGERGSVPGPGKETNPGAMAGPGHPSEVPPLREADPKGAPSGADPARPGESGEEQAVRPSAILISNPGGGRRQETPHGGSDGSPRAGEGKERSVEESLGADPLPFLAGEAMARVEISEAPASGGTNTATPSEAVDRMGEQARLTRRGETREIEILLRPESLGRLRVRVASDGRGVSVRILAEEASAAESLSAHGTRLKADLDAAGLDLADFEIAVASDDRDFHPLPSSEAEFREDALPSAAGRGTPFRGRIDFFA